MIPEEWLTDEYLPILDYFERQDFEKAVRQLSAKGFLKISEGCGAQTQVDGEGGQPDSLIGGQGTIWQGGTG